MNERDRLVKIMESEGMSARQFSQEIGISAGAISNIMSGRNKPSLDVLQAVLRRFRAISCDWLIMGVGNMYLSGNDELTQKEVASILGISQSYISRLEKKIIKKLRTRLYDE